MELIMSREPMSAIMEPITPPAIHDLLCAIIAMTGQPKLSKKNMMNMTMSPVDEVATHAGNSSVLIPVSSMSTASCIASSYLFSRR